MGYILVNILFLLIENDERRRKPTHCSLLFSKNLYITLFILTHGETLHILTKSNVNYHRHVLKQHKSL